MIAYRHLAVSSQGSHSVQYLH